MAYANRTELTTLAISEAALKNVSVDKQDAALEAASRIADGYLNVRYQLPLASYGSDLRKAVCDIAALMLMKGRGFNPELADADVLISGQKDAIKWLEGIAAGKISPYGLVDSSQGGINTEDLPVDQRGPFAVQVQEHSSSEDTASEFWSGGSNVSGGGSVTKPKRRGW